MSTGERPSWERYFLDLAKKAATRSTCPRKSVGAVIVRGNTILATGYNGSIRRLPHCTEIGCLMEDGHCVRTVHAETNAVVHAASHGVDIYGSTIYVTASPCWSCFKILANAGITKIVYAEFYRDQRIFDAAAELSIELVDGSSFLADTEDVASVVDAFIAESGSDPSIKLTLEKFAKRVRG